MDTKNSIMAKSDYISNWKIKVNKNGNLILNWKKKHRIKTLNVNIHYFLPDEINYLITIIILLTRYLIIQIVFD